MYDAVVKAGYLIVDDKQVVVTVHGKRYVHRAETPYCYLAMYTEWDDLVTAMYLKDTDPITHEDVYDLPEVFRTPLHLLEEE
jgi:hypothetical protein